MEEIVLEMDIVSLIRTTSTLNRIQVPLKNKSRGSSYGISLSVRSC